MARHPRHSHGLLSALYPCSMLRYQAATARPALCECLATSTGEVCVLSTQPGSDKHIPRSQRHGLGPLIRSSVFVTCLSYSAVPPILRSPRVEAAVVGWPWLIKTTLAHHVCMRSLCCVLPHLHLHWAACTACKCCGASCISQVCAASFCLAVTVAVRGSVRGVYHIGCCIGVGSSCHFLPVCRQ